MADELQRRLERQAEEMSTSELYSAMGWHSSLAEHYDDNMDYNGYAAATKKQDVIRAELRRRGERI